MDKFALRSLAVLLVVGMLLGAVIAHAGGLHEASVATLNWTAGLGSGTRWAVAGAYVLAIPLMIPTFPLMLASGFLLGTWEGLLFSVVGNCLGGYLAFSISRSTLQPFLREHISNVDTLAALDRAIHAEGFKAACLIRMSPFLPGPVINYGLGLTQVRVRDYLLATGATVPTIFIYTLIGSSLQRLSAVFQQPLEQAEYSLLTLVLLVAGFVLSISLVLLLGRRTRALLATAGVSNAAPAAANGVNGR